MRLGCTGCIAVVVYCFKGPGYTGRIAVVLYCFSEAWIIMLVVLLWLQIVLDDLRYTGCIAVLVDCISEAWMHWLYCCGCILF